MHFCSVLPVTLANGTQIIIETHSDHFINGIRLAVKWGLISSDKVVFHLFSRNPDRAATEVQAVELDENGALSTWPVGFMDQIANDLSKL